MKKTKLILTFYVGIIALGVSTIAMSVAWYVASNQLRISGIDISLDVDRDLKIATSSDGEFKEHIDYSELEEVGVFMPLTSAYKSSWMSLKEKMPSFYDETRFSSYEDADLVVKATRGFYSQKFYIWSDDDVYVSIDASKTTLLANEVYNSSYARTLYEEYQRGDDEDLKKLTVEDIEVRLNHVVKAMRYSILVPNEKEYSYEIIDPYKNEDTYLGGVLDNDIDRYYDYFKKESDGEFYERVYGEVKGDKKNLVYDAVSAQDSGYESADEEPSAFNARHKEGVHPVNLEKSKQNNVEIVKEESHSLTDFSGTTKPYHFPVHRDQPQEIVVSIYVEGWDLDSIDFTKGAAFISNLSFMIEREIE